MCLAIPGKLLTVSGEEPLHRVGRVSFGGIVKEVNLACVPEAKVGGPATTGPGSAKAAKFLDDFLAHVAAKKLPMDFISFHAKGQPRIQGGDVTRLDRYTKILGL